MVRRSLQGGADGIPDVLQAEPVRYGDFRYDDSEGPAADTTVRGGGAGAGLSGMPQANAGNVPPLWDDHDSSPSPSVKQKP